MRAEAHLHRGMRLTTLFTELAVQIGDESVELADFGLEAVGVLGKNALESGLLFRSSKHEMEVRRRRSKHSPCRSVMYERNINQISSGLLLKLV